MENKTEVYERDIAPLVARAYTLCTEHKIPFISISALEKVNNDWVVKGALSLPGRERTPVILASMSCFLTKGPDEFCEFLMSEDDRGLTEDYDHSDLYDRELDGLLDAINDRCKQHGIAMLTTLSVRAWESKYELAHVRSDSVPGENIPEIFGTFAHLLNEGMAARPLVVLGVKLSNMGVERIPTTLH